MGRVCGCDATRQNLPKTSDIGFSSYQSRCCRVQEAYVESGFTAGSKLDLRSPAYDTFETSRKVMTAFRMHSSEGDRLYGQAPRGRSPNEKLLMLRPMTCQKFRSRQTNRWRTGVEARVKVCKQGGRAMARQLNSGLCHPPRQSHHISSEQFSSLRSRTGLTRDSEHRLTVSYGCSENFLPECPGSVATDRSIKEVYQCTSSISIAHLTCADSPVAVNPNPSCTYTVVNRARHRTNTSHYRQRCDRC